MSKRLNTGNFIKHAPESGYFSSVYHLDWTVLFGHVVFCYHHENEMPSPLQLDQSNLVLQQLERYAFVDSLNRWIFQFWLDDFDHEFSEERYKRVGKSITLDNIQRYYRLSEICVPCRNLSETAGFFAHLRLTCDWRLMCAEIVLCFQKQSVRCLFVGNFSGVSGDGCYNNFADPVEREVYFREQD